MVQQAVGYDYCIATVCVHSFIAELKEEFGLCSRSVFGMEPSQMSFLFFLMYAAAAGGVLQLLETTTGSAQEFKIKVHSSHLSLECFVDSRIIFFCPKLEATINFIFT